MITTPWDSIETDREFEERGPLRKSAPDYFYAKARELFHAGTQCAPDLEEPVARMLQFFQVFESDRRDRDLVLRQVYGDIYEAYQIREGAIDSTFERLHIECGILARATPEAVVHVTGLEDPAIVEAYERYFFNVRAQLNNPAFIHDRVIDGAALQRETARETKQTTLRQLIAYHGGWKLHLAFSGGQLGLDEESRELLLGVAQRAEAFKVVLSTLQEQVNPGNLAQILDRHAKTRADRDSATPLDRPEEADQNAVDAWIERTERLAKSFAPRLADEGELSERVETVALAKTSDDQEM